MSINQVNVKEERIENNYGDIENYNSLDSNYYDLLDPNKSVLKLLDERTSDVHMALPIFYDSFINDIHQMGTISPKGNIYSNFDRILVPLKEHQLRSIYELRKRETSNYRFVSAWNVSLLCDNVGSGKSLTILGLISKFPYTDFSTNVYYSSLPKGKTYSWYGRYYQVESGLHAHREAISLKTNLIIVPHTVFNQWQKYISTQTNLNYYYVGTNKNIDNLCANLIEICDKNEIILIKSTMFKNLVKKMNNIKRSFSEFCKNNSESNETVNKDTEKLDQDLKNVKLKWISIRDQINYLKDNNHNQHEIQILNSNLDELTEYILSLKNLINSDVLKKSKNKSVVNYINMIHGFYFERIIIDEVDSIKIPSFPYLYAKQIIYVSSSINNIVYPFGLAKNNKFISTGIRGNGFLREIVGSMFKKKTFSK